MSSEFQTLSCVRPAQAIKILNIGRSTFWAWVKSGHLPPPIKLGARVSVWRVSDIEAFIQKRSSEASQ